MELPAHPELAPAWREVCAQLRRVVGDSTFEIWLSSVEVKAWDGRMVVLEAPPATSSWVATRFGRILESSIRTVIGTPVEVTFAGGRKAGGSPAAAPAITGTEGARKLNPRYSFDQFIIGSGNRLAHGAALAVAEHPGQAYNPLFLHAGPGLGKTHLLHAIGNYVLTFGGGATVRYTTVESFTNHFISALNSRSVETFKELYRHVDVLLIDDVQFLANKARTEEEFFHTFNALYENGRQLVLTCDRLPRQLIGVEERLRERFEAGLVATIQPPDLTTRVAILRKRAALDPVAVADPAVLELVAERITDNVRALEGALIRIVAQHSLTGHPIDAPFARRVLDEIAPAAASGAPAPGGGPAGQITIERIQEVVCAHFGISAGELISAGRAARIAWPRQLAIHLAREFTHCSLEAIGAAFGGRNHATVLHACKRVGERTLANPESAAELEILRSSLAGG